MENDQQQHIPMRQFYDKLDEKYGHDNDNGFLFSRKTRKPISHESLRAQIKGRRQSVAACSFVYWLKTGEVPFRIVKAKDGNRANLRFDNLELATTAEERFNARKQVWLDWCHSSKEEKIEWLKTKPEPGPPKWVE